jgi:hypothetical protein
MALGFGGVWLLKDETLAHSRSGLALPASAVAAVAAAAVAAAAVAAAAVAAAAAAAVRKRRAFRRVERRRGLWARLLGQGDEDEDIVGGDMASVEFPLRLRCFVTVMKALRRFDRFGWWGRRWRQQLWQLAGVGLGVAVCLRMPLLRWLAD